MNPYAAQSESLGQLQAELGSDCPTILWAGHTLRIIPGTAMFNAPLRESGFTNIFDLRFTFRIEDLAGTAYDTAVKFRAAAPNTAFTYLETRYKIWNVHISAGGLQITVDANSASENA